MGYGGHHFAAASRGQVSEKGGNSLAADFREGIAVEEQERGAAMAGFQELKGFEQGQLGRAAFFPFFRNRRVSFRVSASLRAASFAESVMDLGDR